MKIRHLESFAGLVGPLHGTAHADGLLCSVRSVLPNTTHNGDLRSGTDAEKIALANAIISHFDDLANFKKVFFIE